MDVSKCSEMTLGCAFRILIGLRSTTAASTRPGRALRGRNLVEHTGESMCTRTCTRGTKMPVRAEAHPPARGERGEGTADAGEAAAALHGFRGRHLTPRQALRCALCRLSHSHWTTLVTLSACYHATCTAYALLASQVISTSTTPNGDDT